MDLKLAFGFIFLAICRCHGVVLPRSGGDSNLATPSSCANNTYPITNTSTLLPWFVVNLDLPPEQRWNEIGKLYAPRIRTLIEWYQSTIRKPWLRKWFVETFNMVAPRILAKSIPFVYASEMRGLANVTGLPLGQILLYNLFYELEALSVACTSIVARTQDGMSVTHARNLDYGGLGEVDNSTRQYVMTELMRPMAINVHFVRNNRTVLRSTHFAGYVGVLTGVKPQAFSLTVNSRKDGRGRQDLLQWLLNGGAERADAGHWVGFVTRLAMEQEPFVSFQDTVRNFALTRLITPVYFTLAGTHSDDGCVISRAIARPVDVRCLSPSSGGERNATGWYVLETNFDWWKVPGDGRRARAVECMEEKKKTEINDERGVSAAAVVDVLSSKPVFNRRTIYSSVLSPKDGTLESFTRLCLEEDC